MVDERNKMNSQEIIKRLKSFLDIEIKYVLHYNRRFWLCEWDSKIIKEYHTIRKLLKKEQKNYSFIREHLRWLPRRVWYLRKNVFEITFILSSIISTVLYLVYVPVFKGQLSVWVPLVLLVYLFSRYGIINRSNRITSVILQLIKEFEEYKSKK